MESCVNFCMLQVATDNFSLLSSSDSLYVYAQEGGLSDQQLEDFSSSTVCVGWHIKKGMGLGDTVHMIKVFA